jgi:VWFA-related protein
MLASTTGLLLGQEAVFRATARTVALYVTVRDARGRAVSGLRQGDFTVSVDGRPVALSAFDNEPKALTVGMLLDTSRFAWSSLASAMSLARSVVAHVTTADRMTIGTFGIEIAFSPALTSNRPELARVLDEEVWPSDAYPLLLPALKRGAARIGHEPGLKVLVVIGSGGAHCPAEFRQWCGDPHDVRELLLQEDIVVLLIRPGPPSYFDVARRELIERPDGVVSETISDLVEATGGVLVTIDPAGDGANVVNSLLSDLRQSYLLGFDAARDDGHEHQIQVRVNRPDVRVHARRSYVASRQ